MSLLSSDTKQEIRMLMDGLAGAQARKMALDLAAIYKVSEGHIYRISATCRPLKGRSTKGGSSLPANEKTLKKMLAFTYRTDSPATDVIEIFEGNGLLEPGRISPAWFTRWLKAQGMSRREMKIDRRPCTRFEASQPGEVYQIDGTTALQYYIDDDGSVGWESKVSRNKNRPGNRKRRLELILCIDDHSRCVYGEFTNGKTTNHWLNVLFNAFKTKDDPRFRMHGIPWAIYMDNDSIAKTDKFKRAMKALGVRVIKHQPTKKTDRFSNARSKGKIERFIRTVSEKQKRTKLRKFASLEEANRFLFEVCLWYNQRKHSETGEEPFRRWNRIRSDMLIECDDDRLFEILYRDIFERRVSNDMTVRLDGEVWQLDHQEPFYSMVGRTVTIFRHPLEQDRIAVEWQGHEYLVEKKGMAREWVDGPARIPQSNREKLVEEIEATDLSHLKLWGFDQGPAEGVACLPKTGTPLDTGRIKPEPARVPRVDAMRKIIERLGQDRLTSDQNLYLRGVWGSQVTEEEIEQAVACRALPAVREVKAG